MSWGDKNTVSEEVGSSLKCPFPVSSEPQHLLWLDLCQHRRPSLSWQSAVGGARVRPWCPIACNSEGPTIQNCDCRNRTRAFHFALAAERVLQVKGVTLTPTRVPRIQVSIFKSKHKTAAGNNSQYC